MPARTRHALAPPPRQSAAPLNQRAAEARESCRTNALSDLCDANGRLPGGGAVPVARYSSAQYRERPVRPHLTVTSAGGKRIFRRVARLLLLPQPVARDPS